MNLKKTAQDKQSGTQQATQYSQWLQEVLNELASSNDKVDKQIVEHINYQLRLKSSQDDS